MVCICGFAAEDIPTFNWYFLMHLTEIIARQDVWEVYSIHDAINIQSTYGPMTILKKPHTTPVYNHGRFIPTNGINYQGCLYEFLVIPTERLQICIGGNLLTRTCTLWPTRAVKTFSS